MFIMVWELFLVRNGGKVGRARKLSSCRASAALAEDIRPAPTMCACRVLFLTRDI